MNVQFKSGTVTFNLVVIPEGRRDREARAANLEVTADPNALPSCYRQNRKKRAGFVPADPQEMKRRQREWVSTGTYT